MTIDYVYPRADGTLVHRTIVVPAPPRIDTWEWTTDAYGNDVLVSL